MHVPTQALKNLPSSPPALEKRYKRKRKREQSGIETQEHTHMTQAARTPARSCVRKF
jgi:hypothetical protein